MRRFLVRMFSAIVVAHELWPPSFIAAQFTLVQYEVRFRVPLVFELARERVEAEVACLVAGPLEWYYFIVMLCWFILSKHFLC